MDKVVIGGDDAVVFSTFSHTVIKNGRRLNNPAALHLTIANGQIVRMRTWTRRSKGRGGRPLSGYGT
jgi:ketosteroid isomerase-like protein